MDFTPGHPRADTSRPGTVMSPVVPIPEPGCLHTPQRCLWVAGVQISYLASAPPSSNTPDILEHLVPPGAGPPYYLHPSRADAFYIIHGKFRFRCGANESVVTANQFLMIPPGLPHLYENVGEDWGRLLNVITPGGLESLYQELDQASRCAPLCPHSFIDTALRHGVVIISPLHS